ncbi:hypothetical protein [Actinoallomurus soli]|uniref:hypothetical protein n=1 Tax=Actinoallomurus soli TaxID=2952535 RepID=UPI0020929AA3|nr:hypothetical protein [Actinoallomurus soli]MCO5974634.1 hypothetical protein [Actinoallomurus soli]
MARTQTGPRRRADGSSKYGEWFAGLVGDPAFRDGDFCAMGLLWCAWRTGQLPVLGGARREWAWVPSWWRHWQDIGRWTAGAARGRIVFFDFDRSGAPEHVGAVLQDDRNGTIVTIEFNTMNGWCAVRGRRLSDVIGFGDPAWADARVPVAAGGDSCWQG